MTKLKSALPGGRLAYPWMASYDMYQVGRTHAQRLCKCAMLVRQARRQAEAEVGGVVHKLRARPQCPQWACPAPGC